MARTNDDLYSIDYEIALRDPQSVLRRKLGPELQVLEFQNDSFLKVGDSYGSTMFAVRAKVRRSAEADAEELQLVAKMLPASDLRREIFDSGFTFKKEIFIYEELVPLYRSTWSRGDFDVLPECYGCAVSSKDDAVEIDEGAVILLENLKVKGYYMGDRQKGLDREHLKIAIKSLAKFHGIGLSIKHKQPSHLINIRKFAIPLIPGGDNLSLYIGNIIQILSTDPSASHYVDRLKATSNLDDIGSTSISKFDPSDPWTCVVHFDVWMNNLLFHKDKLTDKVDDCKIVDFQTYCFSSPLTDLIFFLCTSMESHFQWFDEMLEFYRSTVLEILDELGSDASELFGKESFEGRLKIDAASELYHIMGMVKIVELIPDEQVQSFNLNEMCLKRMIGILRIFADKKWI